MPKSVAAECFETHQGFVPALEVLPRHLRNWAFVG
jgi:hypothetical protein